MVFGNYSVPLNLSSYLLLNNFSTATRVAHRRKIFEYLAPARYIPNINTKWEKPYNNGPPTTTSRGLFR